MRTVKPPHPAPFPEATQTDGWLPPGGYADCLGWAQQNRDALEAYATQIEHEGTAANQLRQFLDAYLDETGATP